MIKTSFNKIQFKIFKHINKILRKHKINKTQLFINKI